jgi:small redox-active disulfide protein 2
MEETMAQDHTLIKVGKSKIGITGLKQAIEEVSKSFDGQSPEIIKGELFKRLKVRNYIPEPAKENYMEAFWREHQRSMGIEVKEASEELEIKILGPGCPNCERLEQEVYRILGELNLGADVEHVRDLKEIASYGFVATPGLVINGRLVSTGKVPTKARIIKWLEEAKPEE